MGGDRAPAVVIEGASIFASSDPNTSFLLFGDEKKIKPILASFPSLSGKITIIHTEEFISADEKPSNALRKYTKSSMRLAIDSVKNNESDVAISAGNTGALMAISKVILRSLPEINRPAIVSSIPNQKKSGTVLLDMGANIECDAEVLYQFAVMGHLFAKLIFNIENPKIGILNIGSEDLKGHEEVRAAAAILKESHLKDDFYGYVEGDDITKGTVDVVVTDGFSGNIALKTIEGTAKLISRIMKEGFYDSIWSKLGYLFAGPSMMRVYKAIDPRLHNGAMLIGLNGVVVKSHGSTDGLGFSHAVSVAVSLVKNQINQKIAEELRPANVSTDDKQS